MMYGVNHGSIFMIARHESVKRMCLFGLFWLWNFLYYLVLFAQSQDNCVTDIGGRQVVNVVTCLPALIFFFCPCKE